MHKAALANKADQTKEVLSHHKVAMRLRLIANFKQFRNSIATTSASIGMVALQRFHDHLGTYQRIEWYEKTYWLAYSHTNGRTCYSTPDDPEYSKFNFASMHDNHTTVPGTVTSMLLS